MGERSSRARLLLLLLLLLLCCCCFLLLLLLLRAAAARAAGRMTRVLKQVLGLRFRPDARGAAVVEQGESPDPHLVDSRPVVELK